MTADPAAPLLLLASPAPVIPQGDGSCRLDVKFVEGMRAHLRDWPGPIRCILWSEGAAIPFGRTYQLADLGFELVVLHADALPSDEVFNGAALVMASADMPRYAALQAQAQARGLKVATSLEYTFATRLAIVWLDQRLSLVRKLVRSLRGVGHEWRLRRALRQAQAVQFNGWPAWAAYAAKVAKPCLYLDNRMTASMMAEPSEMRARAERLASGAPLRLIHSGRLEPMKGAQDLLPVMAALDALGVPAELDIYGTGSLEAEIRAGLAAFGGRVRLHGAVDFERELVPISRAQADVFLSCHRQSDPSCTYLEAMGCGLAVAGYSNQMWRALATEVGAGQLAPLGEVAALARAIAAWHEDRSGLTAAAEASLRFAKDHDFNAEFAKRMAHLRSLLPAS